MSSAGEVRDGGAFVEIGANLSALEAGLRAAQAKIQSWGKGVALAGAAVFAGGVAVAGGLGAALLATVEMGSEMQDMADRTGLSVESLSQLRHAAEQAGASGEDLEKGLRGMNKLMVDAAGGS